MSLQKSYHQKYNKMSRAFLHKNVYQSSATIEKLTLFYTIEKSIAFKALIKFTSALELITGYRASFIRSKKSSVFAKVRKGAPVGVKVTLRKRAMGDFLLKLIWETLPTIKNLKLNTRLDKIKQRKINTLTFLIPNALSFLDLKNFYFYFKSCLNLRISISFPKNSTRQQTIFIACFNAVPC